MRPDRRPTLLAVISLASLAPCLAAQATLRFHPRVGSLMRTQADVDVTATYVGLPAVPDSETAVLNMRFLVSRRPISQQGNGLWYVQVTLDSARATSRFSNQGRKDVSLPFDGTMLGLGMDSVMGPVAVQEG